MAEPAAPPVIAILSYNKVDLLRRCLESILKNTRVPYHICVVDQASTDGTKNYLRELGDRIDHVQVEENLGFVEGNNLVMEKYADRDIVLLNNDTEVTPGWLEALVNRAYGESKIGIVGAKLIFPDGRLQCAGCEIFSDASGREIGKHDDPDRFIYTRVADVDYCSGACLYLKRSTLEKTGYFDTQFAPAYWEDTDLCFAARGAGLRVVYEPSSVVVHHEGGSYGAPSQRSRSIELQERNRPKFVAKWKKELKKHRSNVFEVPRKKDKDQILVILPFLPLFDRAAGEMRWFHTLKILRERYQVVLLARNGQDGIKYINPLEEAGITVFHTDADRLRQLGCEMSGPLWIDFPALLKSNDFKAVIIGFYHVASQYYKDIRTHSPLSYLIMDSFDVAFLRERRRAEVSGLNRDFWYAEEVKRIELHWYRKADMVLTVTERDRDVLLAEDPTLRVGISTDIHPVPPFEWLPDRRDLVFIGNYKHQPNEDAVEYFVKQILPLIQREIPDVKFYIVGNGPTPAVEALAGENVVVTGHVPDLLPYLRGCRVCVVPLRYGAGLKGKVGQAMAAGIPQVSTAIGAEGMGLVHERDILLADTSEEFARQVVRLYRDEGLQRHLAENARDLVAERYSYENARSYWEEVFEAVEEGRREATPVPGRHGEGYRWLDKRPDIVPRVSIVIPVYNNLSLTETCWASIRKNTKIPHEILIIDNGSDEPVAYYAEQNNYRCIRNERNQGFAEAVNQGMMNTHGDYVVLLNNDCIVTPGWLERLLRHFEGADQLGIVGPLTNYASTEQRIPVTYTDEESLYEFSEEIARAGRGRYQEVKKIVGMCMVIPRKVVHEVGLFDSRFGIGNFEDDDYCLRVRLAGYKVVCAGDVFIHHEGGATFRTAGIDYEALLKKNSEIFLKKWSPVLGTAPPKHESRIPPLSVILFQNGDNPRHPEVERTLSCLPDGTDLCVLSKDSEPFSALETRGARVKRLGENLFRQIDEEIRSAPGRFVLVLSTGVLGPQGWIEEMMDVAGKDHKMGLLAPRCNEGPPVQRVRAGYTSPETGVDAYAQRNREKNRMRQKRCRELAGWCLLVDREAYVQSGGLSGEFHSAAVWSDLALRMKDRGWTTAVALGSYVHSFGDDATALVSDSSEREAVMKIVEAGVHLKESHYEQAVACIEESLRAKPDYAEALYWKALLLAERGRLEEAEETFRVILRVNPTFHRALNNLGCLAFEQGRDEEAEECFLEALEMDPGNRDIARNLGDLYFTTGAYEKATSLFTTLVRQRPDDPEVYLDLGTWFDRLGNRDGAVEWCRRALEVAPDCKEAESRIAKLEAGSELIE